MTHNTASVNPWSTHVGDQRPPCSSPQPGRVEVDGHQLTTTSGVVVAGDATGGEATDPPLFESEHGHPVLRAEGVSVRSLDRVQTIENGHGQQSGVRLLPGAHVDFGDSEFVTRAG